MEGPNSSKSVVKVNWKFGFVFHRLWNRFGKDFGIKMAWFLYCKVVNKYLSRDWILNMEEVWKMQPLPRFGHLFQFWKGCSKLRKWKKTLPQGCQKLFLFFNWYVDDFWSILRAFWEWNGSQNLLKRHFEIDMKFECFLGRIFFGKKSSDKVSGAKKEAAPAECADPGEPSGGVI